VRNYAEVRVFSRISGLVGYVPERGWREYLAEFMAAPTCKLAGGILGFLAAAPGGAHPRSPDLLIPLDLIIAARKGRD